MSDMGADPDNAWRVYSAWVEEKRAQARDRVFWTILGLVGAFCVGMAFGIISEPLHREQLRFLMTASDQMTAACKDLTKGRMP